MLKKFADILRTPNLAYQLQPVRFRYRIRGADPNVAKTLKQIVQEINYIDPEVARKIDIGLPPPRKSKKDDLEKRAAHAALRKDTSLEKSSRSGTLALSLEEVRQEWINTEAPQHVKTAAEHYGIYKDLFGDAFFSPYVTLDITYSQPDGKLAPVYRGNVVKPSEASRVPNVAFCSDPDSLWTLILTNPDGHLTEENKEYVHWFVGNIPGGDVSKGETVYDYLQPFPPRGIGFQRLVFVLYKQDKKVDYTNIKKTAPCVNLSERTFQTLEFYKDRQDSLTPAGLAFYQSDYDSSVRSVFHNQLDMEEPRFEYDFTKPYVAPPKWFARRKAFNMYLDKYRDPRDISKDFLLKKLKDLNPFEPPQKPFPYPNVYKFDRTKTPSWLITELRRVRLGLGRINHQKDE